MCHCCLTVNAVKTVRRRSVDPTKTTALRRQYEKEFRKRWNLIIKAIRKEVARSNGFGLVANAGKFEFTTTPMKVAAFSSFFQGLVEKHLFNGKSPGRYDPKADRWWGSAISSMAYRRGLIGASGNLARAGAKVDLEYVTRAIKRGPHVRAMERLFSRSYESLKGITEEVSLQISRVLAEGLAEGKGPFAIADLLADRVEKIGITRSRLLVRTEVVSAFGEASLNTYEEAGVRGVGVNAEVLTAQDDRVCEECQAQEGKIMPLAQARGAIPFHPNCRCTWIPALEEDEEYELT